MSKHCIIMRGLPGSGKSFRARAFAAANPGTKVFSTDDFWVALGDGEYRFDITKLGVAHRWNQQRFATAVMQGDGPVVVDNTNITPGECKFYVETAVSCGYEVEFWEPVTPWAFDVDELVRRNQHSVPREVIERMLGRWVPNVTVEMVLNHAAVV